MPDKRGWAFDFHCAYHAESLRSRGWHVDVIYTQDKKTPPLPFKAYDLAFNPNYAPCLLDRRLKGKLVRGIYGHKWARCARPRRILDRSLEGAVAVVVPNKKLQSMIGWYFPNTFQISEGTDPKVFKFLRQRTAQDLVVGWTGDPRHTWKRLEEIVRPACLRAGVELQIATNLTKEQLCEFYNDVDVVLIASIEEGSPNAVFEAGACGRTVICTAVGIIPEAISDGENGFIVEGNVDAFAEKLRWCKSHLDQVRSMGFLHRELILRNFTIHHEAEKFADLMEDLLERQYKERRLSQRYKKLFGFTHLKIQKIINRISIFL